MIKKSMVVFYIFLAFSCTSVQPNLQGKNQNSPKVAKNVIFMIVDGMGFEHMKAARIAKGNQPLNFEHFPCKTKVTTCSVEGADKAGNCLSKTPDITDSAAAATAMATGKKVKNYAISLGAGNPPEILETIIERVKKEGKSTGIVATKLFTDATPAAFVSHANDRGGTEKILNDIFFKTLPNVILGADNEEHRKKALMAKKSYLMVNTASGLRDLSSIISQAKPCKSANDCPFIYGGFGQHEMILDVYRYKSGLPLEISSESFGKFDLPHLSEMTQAALTILNKNTLGFFLMVESSMPDMISHWNRAIDGTKHAPKAIEVLTHEMVEVEKTAAVLESFVKNNPDTLVIITADHETGGLVVEADKTACLGQKGCIPNVRWTSPLVKKMKGLVAHTAADVPLYALGEGAKNFCKERINNTDIFRFAVSP